MLGEEQELGKGTGTSISNLKDVYTIELNDDEETYTIKYYGKKTSENTILGTITGEEKEEVVEISVKMKDKDGANLNITNTPESLASVYGKAVSNYTKGGTYRVFFIDFDGKYGEKGTIYLKADKTEDIKLSEAPNRNVEGENQKINTTTYEPTEKAIAMMKKQNPVWGEKDGTVNQIHEKCVAWLCNPTTGKTGENKQWEIYFDGEKANYVIGTPSIEMYVDSYNGVKHETQGNYILGAEYYENGDAHGYKYTLNGEKSTLEGATDYYTGPNSLDNSNDYNKMYVNGPWWFASTSYYNTSTFCIVSTNPYLNGSNYDNTLGVCPVVSLKPSFQVQLAD